MIPTWLRERRDVLVVAFLLPHAFMFLSGATGVPQTGLTYPSTAGFFIGSVGSAALIARARINESYERLERYVEDPETALDD